MLNLLFTNPLVFIIILGFLFISIAVHEFAHALAADRLGDPTARAKGRLTLNPLAHIDMMGALFIVFWGFGWGKPVPYDPFNLQKPSRDSALIALAGPASSLIFALVLAVLLRLVPIALIQAILAQGVMLNITLGIFNLVPLYPLDGFQIMAGVLPPQHRQDWLALSRYGIFILLILLLPLINGQSPLLTVISPLIDTVVRVLLPGGIM